MARGACLGRDALGQAGAASKLVHPLGWWGARREQLSWEHWGKKTCTVGQGEKVHSHVFWALPQFLDGCLLSSN